jgi:hypothetical protein
MSVMVMNIVRAAPVVFGATTNVNVPCWVDPLVGPMNEIADDEALAVHVPHAVGGAPGARPPANAAVNWPPPAGTTIVV